MRQSSPFTVLGIPIDSVGIAGGTELCPATLRALGIVAATGSEDAGDTKGRIRDARRDPESGIVGYADVIAVTREIRPIVAELVGKGGRPILLGGCCTEMIGAVAGSRDVFGRVGIAYFDGHLDLYDGRSSPSGEAADIPLATMLGHGPAELIEAAGGASLRGADVALLGYRDLIQAKGHGSLLPEDFGPDFRHWDGWALRRAPAEIGAAARGRFDAEKLPFWLFLDVDVLDPAVFPATDAFVDDGLDWPDLAAAMLPLAQSPQLLGMALTCYNPDKDADRACGKRLVDLFARLTGRLS